MDINQKQLLAVKKHFASELRKAIGSDDLGEVELHLLTWDQLHRAKQEILSICKKAVDLAEARNDKGFETAYDGLMAAHEEIEGEMSCRKRIGDNGPRSHGGNPKRPTYDDCEERADDGSPKALSKRPDVWRDKNGKEVRTYKPNQQISNSNETGMSFGGAVRAMVLGPRDETERRALSEGTDGSGGYTVPAPLALEFIDALRAQSVVVQSGAITVPMESETLQIAKLASDPAFSWRGELAAVGTGDPTFSRVLFTAKSCAVLVKCSRELLEDSANVEQVLMQAFAQSAALRIDSAALQGSGSDDEPTGILNTPGINTVSMGTNGGAFGDYDPWLDALYELELDNVSGPYSAALHPRTARDLRKLKTGIASDNTSLVMPPSVAEVAQRVTTSLPINETQGTAENASSLIVGNFSNVMIGLRQNLRILMLNERYADTLEVGFVAFMRLDIQVRHPQAFCAIRGVIPPTP